jgi:hypothetical protein
MADKEKIKFLIKLYSEYFDKTPQVSILLNNKIMIEKQDIKGTSDNPDILEFTQELESDQTYEFIIRREGKDKTQTIVENGKIIKDQLLHIDAIEIDDIDLGGLIYEGVYVPNYSEPWATQQKNAGIKLPESFKNVVCMGHNGEWKLKFSSPFYMWLLENLY